MTYEIGDTVYILAMRSEGGCSSVTPEHPSAFEYPVMECRVAQVNVSGCEGVYGLVWADTGEPVGLPFSAKKMAPTAAELLQRVDDSEVAL